VTKMQGSYIGKLGKVPTNVFSKLYKCTRLSHCVHLYVAVQQKCR